MFFAILKIWKAKSSTQIGAFFPRGLPIELTLKTMFAHKIAKKAKVAKNGKIAENQDWNNEISPKVQIFGLLEE